MKVAKTERIMYYDKELREWVVDEIEVETEEIPDEPAEDDHEK